MGDDTVQLSIPCSVDIVSRLAFCAHAFAVESRDPDVRAIEDGWERERERRPRE